MAEKNTSPKQPDYVSYHKTLQAELTAIKDRVRHLIKQHWPTDGAFKEAALRAVLRRHLPESMMVARGFVVTETESSSEIDILVVDRDKPTLFKDGDLVIATPDAVRAIIEVKTSFKSANDINKAVLKLATNMRLCQDADVWGPLWCGLFVYQGNGNKDQALLKALGEAYEAVKRMVNCIAYGPDTFIKYCKRNETLSFAASRNDDDAHVWLSARTPGLAASYFLASMLKSTTQFYSTVDDTVWFSEPPDLHASWVLEPGELTPRKIE